MVLSFFLSFSFSMSRSWGTHWPNAALSFPFNVRCLPLFLSFLLSLSVSVRLCMSHTHPCLLDFVPPSKKNAFPASLTKTKILLFFPPIHPFSPRLWCICPSCFMFSILSKTNSLLYKVLIAAMNGSNGCDCSWCPCVCDLVRIWMNESVNRGLNPSPCLVFSYISFLCFPYFSAVPLMMNHLPHRPCHAIQPSQPFE